MTKTFLRLRRNRVEAALRLRIRQGAPPPSLERRSLAEPDPFDDAPVEIIDLATGPFTRRFPDLAERSRRRSGG